MHEPLVVLDELSVGATVLHCAYARTPCGRWLAAALTDGRGELLDTVVLPWRADDAPLTTLWTSGSCTPHPCSFAGTRAFLSPLPSADLGCDQGAEELAVSHPVLIGERLERAELSSSDAGSENLGPSVAEAFRSHVGLQGLPNLAHRADPTNAMCSLSVLHSIREEMAVG